MRRTLLPLFALLSLLSVPATATITGVVVNPDGQPVAGAKVAIYAPETIEARRERLLSKTPNVTAIAVGTTDSKGAFTFDSPKDHPVVDLRIEASGFAPDAVRLLADDELGAIALQPAPMQRGTITANGKPVAGATVIFIGNNTDFLAVTDADGHYTAPDPSKWASRMAVAHPDYAILQEFLRPGAKSFDRSLNAGIAIKGRVVGQDGKTAASKASVLVDDLMLATTADDGTFTIAHAPKDWQEVQAQSGALSGVRARAGDAAANIRLGKMGTITGTIRDAKSQLPLVNAEVRLGPAVQFGRARGFAAAGQAIDIQSVLTSTKGDFTISAPPGRYSLTAVYPGSLVSNATITVTAGQTLNKPLYGSARARVNGTVVDEAKRPIAGARISTSNANRGGGFAFMLNRSQAEAAAVSGPDGRFVLRNVAAETDLRVDAVKKGLPAAQSATLRLNPGERKSGLLITIPQGVAFAGKVTDGNGHPLSGVAVQPVESEGGGGGRGLVVRRVIMSMMRDRGDEDVRTGSDGSFSLRLKEGTYDVIFKREGFATRTLRAQAVNSRTQPVEIKLDPGVEITGRVTRNGAGVEGVNINAISQDGSANTMTASDGSFALSDLTPGQMMLSAVKPDDFIQQVRPVTAPAKDVVIDLPAGGRITGHVLDKSNNTPVTSFQAGISTSRSGGGMVIMTPPMLKSFTADDGSFTLENVPPGSTQLVVSAPGYTTQRIPGLSVEAGKTVADVEVDLDAGAKLSGRVTGPDGSPLSGVTVRPDTASGVGGRVLQFGGADNVAVTDPNGEYTLDSLDSGEKTFSFTRQGYLTESRTATISGKDNRLDVQLTTGLPLNGVVTTDGGVPVGDASVNAMSASDPGFGRQVRTDANGNFQITGLAAGHYTITASKAGLADGILRDFDVSTGAPARVVMKAGGTITGRVTGLTDAELQQATVTASGPNGNASAEVDSSGSYRIDGAPTGTVRVSARTGRGLGGGKSSGTQSVQVDPGSSVQVDLAFQSSTVISGHVTRNGQPLASAIVAFFPRGGQSQTNASGTTDSNGAYQITGLDDGPYSVSVVDFDRSGSFTSSYTVSGSSTYDIDIKSVTLRGTVVDASSGDPIADATVQIQASGGSGGPMTSRVVPTDPSGAFVVDNIQAGSYQATAQKDGYGHDIRTFVVGDTPPDDLQFKLSPSSGVTLHVVDARDNRLLSANVIRVTDSQGRDVESGSFRIFGVGSPEPLKLTLSPGSYTVTLTAMGYAPQSVSVVSPSDQTVQLTPGGTLILRSRSSAQQRVRLIMPNGTLYPRGPNGVFVLDPSPLTTTLNNVAGGNYTLQVLDGSGNVVNSIPITIVDGQQNVVDV